MEAVACCYGYYLPLIRTGGQPGCKGTGRVCVRAYARVCGGVYTGLHRERDSRGS